MKKRDYISIINPEGVEIKVYSKMLMFNSNLHTPEGIVCHFAKIECRKRDDLSEESCWPRTYNITLFNGEKQEIKVGAKKILSFYVDK